MKKKFLLFLGIIFFFNMSYCYGKSELFYFKMANDSDGTLFNFLCSDEAGLSCYYYCKGGKEKLLGTVSQAVSKCENEGAGVGYDSIDRYASPNYDSIELLYKELSSRNTWDGVKGSSYVEEKYCNNYTSKEDLCKQLKKVSDEGNNQKKDDDGNVVSTDCSITVKPGMALDSDAWKNLNVAINVTKSGKASLYNSSLDQKYSFNVFDDHMYNNDSIFYLYPKDSSFDKFSSELSKKIFDSGKSKCPTLNFCLEEVSPENTNGKYTWWTELGECDTSKYSNISQSSSGSGTNSGVKLNKNAPDWEKLLFKNKNMLTISSCKELLGGENSTELVDLLKNIVTVVKVLIPLILISLGTLDFAKAVFSNEDTMKKCQKKFIQRIIIAIVIFLIPSLLKVLLTLADSIWGNISSDLCGIL